MYLPIELLNIQSVELNGAAITWNSGATLEGVPPLWAARFRELPDDNGNCRTIRCARPLPGDARPEAYLIEADDAGGITLYANDDRGTLYGLALLRELFRAGAMRAGRIHDYPNCPDRILKLFLPSADRIAEFRTLIAFAARFKYNAVMLEIGGAMEYKSHPEINEGWIERCRFMNEYPGKTQEIQHSFRWEKNSIHSENGGGGVLPQALVRELIAYCREFGMEVIPEMPSLSHSDYLLTRHPELAERDDDPYPDTYCPSNPASRRLLFDLLEEVIEVFTPERLNFGHDEFYVMSHCPRCRGKSGMLLYAEDVRAIAEFLDTRRVRGMIWGDKLLNAYFKDGTPIGGSRKEPEQHGSTIHECQEAVYPAIDLVPASLEILQWYWSIDRNLEEAFHDRNFRMLFGNFTGFAVPDWKLRRDRSAGVMISNWGSTDWDTLQRNGILFELAYDSALLWNSTLGDEDFPLIREWTLRELYRLRRSCADPERSIELLHTTTYAREFRPLFDGYFRRDEDFLLGYYRIRFKDGGEQRTPVYYGGNIGSDSLSAERKVSEQSDCFEIDQHLAGVSFSTLPEFGPEVRFRTTIDLVQHRNNLEHMVFEPSELLGGGNVEFTVI